MLAVTSAPEDGLRFSQGPGGFGLWGGSPSGALGLAASGAQELALGDNVGPAAQQLLTALADKVLPVPGQVLHALVVLGEDDLDRAAEDRRGSGCVPRWRQGPQDP